MYKLNNGRIYFKEITTSEEDTDCVIKWRNTDVARKYFFNKDVVTPDIHRNFIKNKKYSDIVFMVFNEDHKRIGMIAVDINIKNYTAEYGRTFIDENYRENNYAEETGILMLSYIFDVLNLKSIWLEVYFSNEKAIQLYKKLGWYSTAEIDKYEGDVIIRMENTKDIWNKNKEILINNLPKNKMYSLIELENTNIKNKED